MRRGTNIAFLTVAQGLDMDVKLLVDGVMTGTDAFLLRPNDCTFDSGLQEACLRRILECGVTVSS